jgi:toxin CcdB
LNPVFEIEGKEYVMLTQAAAAVRRRELGTVIASLAERSFDITGALDVLLSGV